MHLGIIKTVECTIKRYDQLSDILIIGVVSENQTNPGPCILWDEEGQCEAREKEYRESASRFLTSKDSAWLTGAAPR